MPTNEVTDLWIRPLVATAVSTSRGPEVEVRPHSCSVLALGFIRCSGAGPPQLRSLGPRGTLPERWDASHDSPHRWAWPSPTQECLPPTPAKQSSGTPMRGARRGSEAVLQSGGAFVIIKAHLKSHTVQDCSVISPPHPKSLFHL